MLAATCGFFLYMVAFMDTTATIHTGSMAERWKWKSFVVWGLFCGAIYYPLFGAWTWGGGWLSSLKAGVPAELHVYERGRHGVGLAPGDPVLSSWPDRLAAWLDSRGLLKKK